jgi:branched-chain amino acid transport system ATP-binding protein
VSEPLLRLERLQKSFGGLRVTDDVTLAVMPGEAHAIIGPNGAGKTTLLNEVSGLVAVDAGRILFDNADITRLPAHRRARAGIARSFQITSIVPGFTARENVMLAVQARSGVTFGFVRPAARDAAAQAASDDALAQVGLAARASTPAGLLSHGEKRALELAMAIALEPRLLLLDEPAAGAGPSETEQLVSMLSALKRRYAMLLIEHDMQAVFALADRISVLVYGRIIASGAPDAIRNNPAVREAYLGEEAG